MSQEDKDYLIGLKRTLWQVAGTLIVAVIIATVPFYFKTQNRLDNVEKRQESLDFKKADRNVYELTVKTIQDDVKEIKQDIKDLKNR